MPTWERVEEDDPNRCQTVIPTKGQCLNKACPDSKHCPAHGGNRAGQEKDRESLKLYRFSKFKQRMTEISEHPKLKSLTVELGALKMLFEMTINKCEDEHDLMLQSPKLMQLVANIERVAQSCQKLDIALNRMLDENQAMQFVSECVEAVAKHVKDSELRELISTEMFDALDRITGEA